MGLKLDAPKRGKRPPVAIRAASATLPTAVRARLDRWPYGVLVIVGLGLAAFAGGFHGAFFFDDEFNVVTNLTIRQWHDWGRLLWADPANLGVSGHPLLNVLYAVNYWAGGLATTGYHVVNLAIHLAAAVALWAVLARTFALAVMSERLRPNARFLALCAVLIWLVHPLQTNVVTYISQRAEGLVGLCYLMAAYGLLRRAAEPTRLRWTIVSAASLGLGMLVKENIATAPVVLALFDRAYLAQSWSELWRRRRSFYLALASTWLLLLNVDFHRRGYGFVQGVDSWHYALTEARVLGRYVGVIFWPAALVFDYGDHFAGGFAEVWPWVAGVGAALAATGWAWRRDPRWGFVGAAFFLLLAPTSSVIPFEHMPYAESRLYLPLAVVVAALVAGSSGWLGRRGVGALTFVLVPLLACGTSLRERLFVDQVGLFKSDLARYPGNARNHCNLGEVYFARGQIEAAAGEFRAAIRLAPDYTIAITNLGACLEREGHADEAIADYRRARRLDPYYPYPRVYLSRMLVERKEWAEAAEEYRQLTILQPRDAEVACNLGYCDQQLGRWADALNAYTLALALDDGLNAARNDRGGIYVLLQRYPEAVAELQEAVRRQPDFADAYLNLGNALAAEGRDQPALQAYVAALRINPRSTIGIQAIQELVIKMGAAPVADPALRPAKL